MRSNAAYPTSLPRNHISLAIMPTLNDLSLGEQATISQIEGTDAVAMRLMEMGLFEGETVRFISKAPFGDPLEYEVSGCRISLRSTETQRVHITVQPPASQNS